MNKLKTYAEIKGSNVYVKNIAAYITAITNLNDGLYLYTLDFVYDTKTMPQLGYYFSVIATTLQRLFKEENKEFKTVHYCHKLLEANCSHEETELNNVVITNIINVRDMDARQMNEYIDKCRFFLLDVFKTETPDPDLNWKDKI